MLEGKTEAEPIAKIERFVLGDRTLLIQELTTAIASWREQVAEYEEMGKTDEYWKELAERDRYRMGKLEAMLDWALSTSDPEHVDDIRPVQHDNQVDVLRSVETARFDHLRRATAHLP